MILCMREEQRNKKGIQMREDGNKAIRRVLLCFGRSHFLVCNLDEFSIYVWQILRTKEEKMIIMSL